MQSSGMSVEGVCQNRRRITSPSDGQELTRLAIDRDGQRGDGSLPKGRRCANARLAKEGRGRANQRGRTNLPPSSKGVGAADAFPDKSRSSPRERRE
ncbi:hypothetical protein R1flu_000379 [Riccia fluitans]|uniref:Uncharacterized protein n=1 Tax=Riccia fluitans TaxID=41844 RepID=A0ABD1Y0A2_9MARC